MEWTPIPTASRCAKVAVAGRIAQPARIERIVADGKTGMVCTERVMIADENLVREGREWRSEDTPIPYRL